MKRPVTVATVRERARRFFERHSPTWAASGDDGAVLSIPLHPPTERAALEDLAAARSWVKSWQGASARLPVEVEWEKRSWARVGTQLIPVRVLVRGPEAIAAVAQQTHQWQTLSGRLTELRSLTGTSESAIATLRSHARAVAGMSVEDFTRLCEVLTWLGANPDSGHLVRELPIRGIDSKWVERRRGLIESLHHAATGNTDLGLRDPAPLVRMRILDPALAIGGLRDITAPVADLAELALTPERVFVFENLNTLLAMPDTPGAVVLDGGGHRVTLVAQIPWARRVTYWGDLDSHGFAILHRLRSYGIEATSVLMDRDTLTSHVDLCGVDPSPNTGVLATLNKEEQSTLSLLSAKGNLRLEQERIPWPFALDRLLG